MKITTLFSAVFAALLLVTSAFAQTPTVSITISWTVPDTAEGRLVKEVIVKQSTGTAAPAAKTRVAVPAGSAYPLKMSHTFTGLAVGTIYNHSIQASDGQLNGPDSAVVKCGRVSPTIGLVIDGCDAQLVP